MASSAFASLPRRQSLSDVTIHVSALKRMLEVAPGAATGSQTVGSHALLRDSKPGSVSPFALYEPCRPYRRQIMICKGWQHVPFRTPFVRDELPCFTDYEFMLRFEMFGWRRRCVVEIRRISEDA